MNFVEREKETEKFWRENDIFKKSMENRKEGETYTFYDGPPTANGKPHIGHVLTRVIKDMIPRYQTMKGKYVPRKAGWDTHGLPVELEVEKMLGLNGKEQIEEYGMEPFIKKCKESVWKYKGMWEDFSGTVGFWADMDNPYVTYDDNFIESEWWALKTIWDKKLLYKGFKIVPYCPRCGTPLSSQEVAQGYKTVKERSAIVRFKVVGEDAYFLAWTTTPWTLPSNVALCVNPDDTYIKVKAADGYTYYLAEALADKVLSPLAKEEGQKAYEVLETYKGKDLEYKEYEPLYDCAKTVADKQHKKGFFVTCDTYVTMTDGTGIVHIAPAFGEDDANVGRNYDLPFVQFVNGKGDIGVGHVRYSTAGASTRENAQPLVLNYVKGTLALAHNGNLINAKELRHDLEYTGAIFQTTIDSEVIAYHIARERLNSSSAEEAVRRACQKLKGAYALVVSSPRKLIGARDPYGFKPLCIGKRDNAYIITSETCALDTIGAEYVRDVLPGEVVTITPEKGIESDMTMALPKGKEARCIFEYIYFACPDSHIDGVSVYASRILAGRFLAQDSPVEADIVTGVPESGNAAALGYSLESGIPYGTAFVKNSYVGRTFIKPKQSSRESSVQVKLNVLREAVAGKRVVMIDDSIVRGTTSDRIVRMLRDAGATEVHVRISSPPFLWP